MKQYCFGGWSGRKDYRGISKTQRSCWESKIVVNVVGVKIVNNVGGKTQNTKSFLLKTAFFFFFFVFTKMNRF